MPQYYPKSQIQPNLYTNGDEYFLKNTQTPYIGYYYKLSTNKAYTGKNPNNSTGVELIPNTTISGNPPNSLGTNPPNYITTSEDKRDAPDNDDDPFYNYDTTLVPIYPKLSEFQPRTLPQSITSLPSPKEMEVGEYRRYFAKKTNGLIYIEISKETYGKFNSKDPTVASDLYEVAFLPWNLNLTNPESPTPNEINKKMVALTERNYKWYGFTSYFQDQFG